LCLELGQVHVQGGREQQQRQHALQQYFAEVDGAQERIGAGAKVMKQPDRIEPDQAQRNQECDRHHADGGRQADPALVQVGQQGGDGEADRGYVEH
jgi:hypothetical protein